MILYTYYIPETEIDLYFLKSQPPHNKAFQIPIKTGAPFGFQHTQWPWGIGFDSESQDAPEGLPRNQGAAPNRLMHEYGRDFWSQKKRGGGDDSIDFLAGVW